ncbi:bifunctional 2-keto-4-hydroxyglutarate aldolase/2-keto-3-deoxy-6-phosphogluconate aldolase [Lysinibacillus agricola]|uniref:Bifunctional 2-keto-4-hydroxyglutarate aldolase/2-keto-3-deoxy-6-phosphogluconate aldolase n=1 Tax=Lysinibacillus agricola TaxID=2590012 RepID=A0ABX7AX39_9BACI|nr:MULTISPECIES: bifunctional 2-keto-4-hydroxyglutarate aldolase/2-keto-3-deoxy-6-phosphogluconate aldolase [Lysinibacillus]KOS62877.1 ketohydroxyglutarate aldolase [Lysinibacillus sp. FJAT-14222]QQP13847.1 bifunctional 2-keto-4-hydroxyglutarate aldolase/2-keto-3-deoxy-6-phosphogluconate aldolase [Lysinibacillus agricola]
MITKHHTLKQITDAGLVAVVRAENIEQAKKITEAALNGGVAAIEITFTIPGATKVIEELANTFQSDTILGAGTVLDAETARIAILAGAKYIVSPSFSVETARLCNRYQIPYMPGVMTIEAAIQAMEYGADLLKVFPGELMGPKVIKAFKGPLPRANLMPTGGVNISNVSEWIRAGAVAVGAGGSLIGNPEVDGYDKITQTAKVFLQEIQQARNN